MQGILYLDKAPKLLVDAPTATANIMANTKHISNLGSAKAIRKKFPTPLLKKKNSVKKSKIADSMAEKKATGELTSHKKGRKNVATRLLGTRVTGFDVLIEKLDPSVAVSERF
jgi:hypothetical protein